MRDAKIIIEFPVEKLENILETSGIIPENNIYVRKRTLFGKALKTFSGNPFYLGLIANPNEGGSRFIIAHTRGNIVIFQDTQTTPLLVSSGVLDTEKRLRNYNHAYTYSIVVSNSSDINSFQKNINAIIYPIENFL